MSKFAGISLRASVPDSGEAAVRQIYKANSNVNLVFTRDYNGNVVCLECNLNKNRNKIESISSYWLNLEESYRKKRVCEYEALKSIERKLAFDFKILPNPPSQNIEYPRLDDGNISMFRIFFYFSKFKSKIFLVQLEKKKDGSLNCCTYASSNSNTSSFIYNIKVLNLHAIVNKRMGGLPSVQKVFLKGFDILTRKAILEEFTKK